MSRFESQTRHHSILQTRGIEYFKSLGYEVEDVTYHNPKIFSERSRAILMNLDNKSTSLFIKTWPDNWMIREDSVIGVDWKALEWRREPNPGKQIPNASIEATDYAFLWLLAHHGVRIMIAYWDPFYDVEKGFFLDGLHPFGVVNSRVRFPEKADLKPDSKKVKIQIMKNIFGDRLIVEEKPKGNNVSPDPYFLIFADQLEKLGHWKNLIGKA